MPRNYGFEEIMFVGTHTRHTQAQIEFWKHKEMIRRCVDEGCTIKSLWEALAERELVTVSYSAFRMLFRWVGISGTAVAHRDAPWMRSVGITRPRCGWTPRQSSQP